MAAEPKKWCKPTTGSGRQTGLGCYIPEEMLKEIKANMHKSKRSKITNDTPTSDLRYTRYVTNSRQIIIRFKHKDDIKEDEK